jgi:hypothetical protein
MPRSITPPTNPWDRQPGEPNDWYHRFHAYLLAGPDRSVEAAYRAMRRDAAECGTRAGAARRANNSWYSTAARWDWAGRAAAYDQVERVKVAAAREKKVAEINERHALQARAIHNAVIKRWAQVKPEDLTPSDCVKFAEAAMRMERLALGEPIAIERHQHSGAGPEAPPVAHAVQVRSTFEPTPEFLATVIGILATHGGLDDPVEPESAAPAAAKDPDHGQRSN